MKNASLGGRPLNRTSCIEVLPHLHKSSQSAVARAEAVPHFRKPVSRIFVRMTSTTGTVELEWVEAVESIQLSFLVQNEIPGLQRPTSVTKDL